MDNNILPSFTPRYEDVTKELDKSNAFAIASPNANCTNAYNQVLYALVNPQTKEVIINPLKYRRTYIKPVGFSEVFLCKEYLVSKYKRFRCSPPTSDEDAYPEASEGYRKEDFTRTGSKRSEPSNEQENRKRQKPNNEEEQEKSESSDEFDSANASDLEPPLPIPDKTRLDACKQRVFIKRAEIPVTDKDGKVLYISYGKEESRSKEGEELIKHYGNKYQDVPFFDQKEIKKGSIANCPADQNFPKLCSNKQDYFKQSLMFHPDYNPGCVDQATEKFQTLGAVCNYEGWKACDVAKGGSMCRKSSKGQRRNKKYRKNHRTKKGVVGTRTRRRK